jgi:predicted dehydrogenase
MRVDLGLIGCGAAARAYYVDALKACASLLGQIYFVDITLPAAQELAAQFPGSTATHDYKEIADHIHVAIIALPHFLHFESTMYGPFQ